MDNKTHTNTELALAGPEIAIDDGFIKSRIFTIRGVQVMLDRDLAQFYGVTTGALNQAVKRNIARFPERFMFRMSRDELANLKSQFVISSWGGDRSLPYVFTEQGVAMLSGLLKSDAAIQISIKIMDAFVIMRKTLASIAPMLARLEVMERRQIADQSRNDENQQRNEERFDTIFKAMDGGEFPPQKVFFDGKHYEAYSFARKLVKKAAKSIVLVDPFVDEVTLDILAQKKGWVEVLVATQKKYVPTEVATLKFNKQNPTLTAKATARFHDRFMILDGKELYHFGASLNQLGRHYCAVVKMDPGFIPSILANI